MAQVSIVGWDELIEEDPPLTPEEEEELGPIPEDAIDVPAFMVGHQLLYIKNLNAPGYDVYREQEKVESLDRANIITSKIKGTRRHRPILDLDFEAALIPSTTEGHHHLYLDKELSEDEMDKLVNVLYEVGILSKGNMNQWWSARKELSLRLPWIKKKVSDGPKE